MLPTDSPRFKMFFPGSPLGRMHWRLDVSPPFRVSPLILNYCLRQIHLESLRLKFNLIVIQLGYHHPPCS